MASISEDKAGNRTIQFVGKDKKRRSVRLGKMPLALVREIKTKVQALNYAAITGYPVDGETARWVSVRDQVLTDKLAAVGLIPRREFSDATLGAFIDAYLAGRTDIKPRTRINFDQVRRDLVAHFGERKPLRDVTPGDTDEWRRWLLTRKKPLGENTVRRHCGRAKQLFRAALRKRMIAENPFGDMKGCSVQANKSREYFVTVLEAAKVLQACPDHEWRLIFALCRFGGLRCPSEVLMLRWGDVDWEQSKLLVRSPKTEHHEGKESRLVPIFPELRPYLEAAWDVAAPGTEFVISRYRDGNTNLRTQLNRIIHKAGLKPWPKLFQNLRSTRETELAERFPLHLVTAWLGNSQLVATKHYLQVTDDHFAQAASKPTTDLSSQKEAVQNPVQYPTVCLSKTQELDLTMLEIQRNPVPYDRIRDSRYPRQESNL